MKIIEFFGLPGSGKSFLFKKFALRNQNVIVTENILIRKTFKKNFYLLYLICDKILSRHYLLVPNFISIITLSFFKNFFLKKLIIKKKKINLINSFNKLIALSNFNKKRKIRIRYFFYRTIISENYYFKNKMNYNLFLDQSLIQFPYLTYENIDKNKNEIAKLIGEYYKNISKKRILIYNNTTLKKCISRLNARNYGKFYLTSYNIRNFSIINKICHQKIRDYKFEILMLNDSSLSIKNIKKIKKYIN